MCFIGIDIGTSSISSVAYDLENNKIESVTITNDSTIVSKVLWEKIQSPDRIIEIVDKAKLSVHFIPGRMEEAIGYIVIIRRMQPICRMKQAMRWQQVSGW